MTAWTQWTQWIGWLAIAGSGLVGVGRPGRYPGPQRGEADPVTQRVGRMARKLAGRRPDPDRDRGTGRVLVAAVTLAVLDPVLAAVFGPLALTVPAWASRRASQRRAATIERELIVAVDLSAVAFESGYGPVAVLGSVADRLAELDSASVLAPAIAEALARHRQGLALDQALGRLGAELGAGPARLFDAIDSHDRLGARIGDSLADTADELRRDRHRRIETEARRLPVKMLLPLVGCILPAFVLLTVAPIVVDSLSGLST